MNEGRNTSGSDVDGRLSLSSANNIQRRSSPLALCSCSRSLTPSSRFEMKMVESRDV